MLMSFTSVKVPTTHWKHSTSPALQNQIFVYYENVLKGDDGLHLELLTTDYFNLGLIQI